MILRNIYQETNIRRVLNGAEILKDFIRGWERSLWEKDFDEVYFLKVFLRTRWTSSAMMILLLVDNFIHKDIKKIIGLKFVAEALDLPLKASSDIKISS